MTSLHWKPIHPNDGVKGDEQIQFQNKCINIIESNFMVGGEEKNEVLNIMDLCVFECFNVLVCSHDTDLIY